MDIPHIITGRSSRKREKPYAPNFKSIRAADRCLERKLIIMNDNDFIMTEKSKIAKPEKSLFCASSSLHCSAIVL